MSLLSPSSFLASMGDRAILMNGAGTRRGRGDVDRDEEIQIDRARKGDPAGVDWLLARYRSRVIRLATHVLRRPAEAEDVAQEAFVRAFRSLDSYREEGSFYIWLYRIVVRVCLDRRSLSRWNREASLEDAFVGSFEAEPTTDDLETRIVVEKLIDRLSPPLRAALVLRELEGLEYEEIARVLQIPIGLVRWRLHTARKRFQQLWRESEADHV